MHLKQQAGIRTDGFNIILKVGAVGGPISRRTASLVSRISGMRKPPPICTSSPREITTSFGGGELPHDQHQRSGAIIGHHRRFRAAQFGEALLNVCGALPRRPVVRSISRLVYPVLVGGAMGARPRLVWTTTPVPLMTGCSRERASRPALPDGLRDGVGVGDVLGFADSRQFRWMVFTTNGRGSGQSATASSSVSTPGMARSVGFVFAISLR